MPNILNTCTIKRLTITDLYSVESICIGITISEFPPEIIVQHFHKGKEVFLIEVNTRRTTPPSVEAQKQQTVNK